MNERAIEKVINDLGQDGIASLVHQGKHIGIEKEMLRIDSNLALANTPHPKSFGAPLTNPYVTTDFSEAMVELVTPPLPSIEEACAFADDVHCFVVQNLESRESLWPNSMPCPIQDENNIPLARYGKSNLGKIKTIYRRGLGYRYGRPMQLIAGVHFNYSYSMLLWQLLYARSDKSLSFTAFRNSRYMSLIRNFLRIGWSIPYLFGETPAMHQSFSSFAKHPAVRCGQHTCILPNGTSLRMSDIGYQNNLKAQNDSIINYNSFREYITSILKAITSRSETYEKIGLKRGYRYLQLNVNLLQNEHEHYSTIRPKRQPAGNRTALSSLNHSGIEYIEMRSLDIDCSCPSGINPDTLYFIELLFFLCLIDDGHTMDKDEHQISSQNEILASCKGRKPDLRLDNGKNLVSIKQWGEHLCAKLETIAALFDEEMDTPVYAFSLLRQREKFLNQAMTPSSLFIQNIYSNSGDFINYVSLLMQKHQTLWKQKKLDKDMAHHLFETAGRSLDDLDTLEKKDNLSLDAFIQNYFRNIKDIPLAK